MRFFFSTLESVVVVHTRFVVQFVLSIVRLRRDEKKKNEKFVFKFEGLCTLHAYSTEYLPMPSALAINRL